MDNLNTHIEVSLYKTFNPKEARLILDKLAFHYTSIHGSCLNTAEIEFSFLTTNVLKEKFQKKQP